MENDEQQYILPDELWEEVFGYLTHTEKLISRLVSSEWNRLISTNLSKHTFFSLTSDPRGQQVLIDSHVPWKKISLTYYLDLSLPSIYKDLITTVRVIIPGWSKFKDWMDFMSQFPNLINLDLGFEFSDAHRERPVPMITDHVFKERVKKLKELSIKFPFNRYNGMSRFLKFLDFPGKMSLTKLSVKEDWDTYQGIRERERDLRDKNSLQHLRNIISNASETLKFMELVFRSREIRKKLFSDLVQNLCTLKTLKLESIFISPEMEVLNGNPESDFDIHQKFLKIQIGGGGVKRLSLPWSSDINQCDEFMQKLPEDVEFIGFVHKEHTRDSMFENLGKLKSMYFTGSRESACIHVYNQCPNIQAFSIDIQKDVTVPENQKLIFYTSIGQTLTHLLELHIERGIIGGRSLYDHDLQLIISYFRQLRVLHIDCGQLISDEGVSGIEKRYVDELTHTRRFYSCPEIQEENMIGLPLSSLRFLEKLTLRNSSVTDIGIFYGLLFGSTLKHVSISSTGRVSDWGLEHLGNGNPSLESFEGEFRSDAITVTAHEILRKRLPLVEYTNKFKFVNRVSGRQEPILIEL